MLGRNLRITLGTGFRGPSTLSIEKLRTIIGPRIDALAYGVSRTSESRLSHELS